jgi:hypothetical protein
MKQSDMLQKMCQHELSAQDVKALCKARGLPAQAASSRGVLETLFVSTQGLTETLNTLDAREIALLHALKDVESPVDISFFSRIYGRKDHGTYNQKYQDCFAKVKQRLVRAGVLVMAQASVYDAESKMKCWRFALPVEFHRHLPPILRSRALDGRGDSRPQAARDKLIADLGAAHKDAAGIVFRMEENELRILGQRFTCENLKKWQQSSWLSTIKNDKETDKNSKPPNIAVLELLSELPEGNWVDAEQLADPLEIFCGRKKIDVDAVCEAGVQCGLIAKRQLDGKTWYRVAPLPPDVTPAEYLQPLGPRKMARADLTKIPFDALENIVTISDQQLDDDRSTLLLRPNLIKLGRADDELLASPAVHWLIEQTQPFAEAFVELQDRRGKTILHENIAVARVTDLSLKVAIEKELGNKLVTLKNDFIAFPSGLIDDVRRVVKKSGHVVKEIAGK